MLSKKCYFYSEIRDMGAHIPTCRKQNCLGVCLCENCKSFIPMSEADKVINSYLDKRDVGGSEDSGSKEVRPIDANALMKKVCENCPRYDCTPDATDTVYGCMFADSVDSMPTIKPEVRHGRWIEESEPDENGNVISMCNQCYHTDEHGKNIKIPYCWYCGSLMDATDTNDGGNGGDDNDT